VNIAEFVDGIDLERHTFPDRNEQTWEALNKIQHIERMSTWAVAGIINWAVSQTKYDHAYLDIGVWHGYTMLAGMIGNDDKRCVGVDNFSQFDKPRDEFVDLFDTFASPKHEFYEMDFHDYLRKAHVGPLGVYLFDGPHDYNSQKAGLELALPYMAPGCLVLVDDTDWVDPRRATTNFLNRHKELFRLAVDRKGEQPSDPNWWNGLMILERL
jgi:hypothetical protein